MKEFLKAIHPVSDELLDEYLSHWKPFTADKDVLLTQNGDTEKYLYYVLEGIQKSYYLQDGKEHIIAFTYAPSFSGIPESFMLQKPSQYNLKTITKSSFLRISYTSQQKLLAENPPLETLFRKGTEVLLAQTLQRYYELMAYDIEKRFTLFCKRSPHMLQLVSNKDIASYLNINVNNFSKLLNSVKI